jgi:hypothetical protein
MYQFISRRYQVRTARLEIIDYLLKAGHVGKSVETPMALTVSTLLLLDIDKTL